MTITWFDEPSTYPQTVFHQFVDAVSTLAPLRLAHAGVPLIGPYRQMPELPAVQYR